VSGAQLAIGLLVLPFTIIGSVLAWAFRRGAREIVTYRADAHQQLAAYQQQQAQAWAQPQVIYGRVDHHHWQHPADTELLDAETRGYQLGHADARAWDGDQ